MTPWTTPRRPCHNRGRTSLRAWFSGKGNPMSDDSDSGGDVGYQLREGGKSILRVVIATAINPALGAAALIFESGRTAAIGLSGEEGGRAVGNALRAVDASDMELSKRDDD